MCQEFISLPCYASLALTHFKTFWIAVKWGDGGSEVISLIRNSKTLSLREHHFLFPMPLSSHHLKNGNAICPRPGWKNANNKHHTHDKIYGQSIAFILPHRNLKTKEMGYHEVFHKGIVNCWLKWEIFNSNQRRQRTHILTSLGMSHDDRPSGFLSLREIFNK